VTVVDTSAVVDFLLGEQAAGPVEAALTRERVVAAPDVLVFEVLAVLRRQSLSGLVSTDRALGAVDDLGDFPVELYPSLPLRSRAWELRENFTMADALFVVLAERLGEPFMTKDGSLASAARRHTTVQIVEISAEPAAGEPESSS
jgi:predicted nucleic acid-binding protein